VNERGIVSLAHCIVHVEPSRHSRPQLDVHENAQVDPCSHVALEPSPIETVQFAPFVQRYEALDPACTVQCDMSHDELELSPTVTLHVEPIEQVTLHDIAHVPLQLVPAPQLTD